jgi:hypothetical protein
MSDETREQYIERCKQEAIDLLGMVGAATAVSQFIHDMKKNPATENHADATFTGLAMIAIGGGDDAARRFIEGFR